MAVSMQAIKELRERTQAGMNDCKVALTEAEGDMEKAVEIILKKGKAKVAKRAGAVASEGEVRAAVADGNSGVIVEVNIQTDFAARNDQFVAFVGDVVEAAQGLDAGADIQSASLKSGKSVKDTAEDLTAKIGEKVEVRRWAKLALADGQNGFVTSYVHLGGKIGVLLQIHTASADAAKHAATTKLAEDTAMHIAAMGPQFLVRADVPEDLIAKQKEIFEGQLREDPKPKPEAAWPKIIEGKLNKWFSEVTLMDQESVVTPGSTITKLAEAASKEAGAAVEIAAFVRYERGEGIQKKEDDFAAEVAKMAGGES